MINLCNKTPFSISITIHGAFRISDKRATEMADAPPLWFWFMEWIYILFYGPLYKTMSFVIKPWDTEKLRMVSNVTSTITMGFSDPNTHWKKHMPGIYKWDSKDMTLNIHCEPGEFQLIRRGRGPMIAGDVPLEIITKSTNPSWEISQKPITLVQYLPKFNYDYYKTHVLI